MEEKFYQLLSKLQNTEIRQTSMEWSENIPDDLWADFSSKGIHLFHVVDSDLDVDKHRWYETSITVIEIYGKLLGIRFVTDLFSEESSVEDICFKISFFEMEAVPSVTYKKK